MQTEREVGRESDVEGAREREREREKEGGGREGERETEREREGGRKRGGGGRERGREREREGVLRETERDREFHGEITSTSAQSEIFKPSHSHITNSSIYCRCKLTWSPMYCTNRIGPTEILMAGHNRQDQHWQLITERERESSPSRQQ